MGEGHLVFVWKTTGYELREGEGDPPAVGTQLEQDGETLRVTKIASVAAPRRPPALRVPRRRPEPALLGAGVGRELDAHRRAVVRVVDGQRRAERPRPLFEHLDRAAAALARRVVVDRQLERASSTGATWTENSVGGPRRIAPSNASRTIS